MAHALMVLFADTVVPLFFLGMAGSALVVVATTVHDLGEVISSDEMSDTDLDS